MNNTLYVSDLDGTLLRSDATLSDYARGALTELLDDGLMFTVASARGVFSMRSILGDLPIRLPVVSFNGGFISDYQTSRHMRVESIASGVAADIVARTLALGLSPFMSTTSPRGDRVFYADVVNGGMAWYVRDRAAAQDPRMRPVDRLPADQTVMCLTVIGHRELLEPLRRAVVQAHGTATQPQLYENAYSPEWWWLTFNGGRATKANALRTMLADREFGLPEDTRLVVFGDQHNDVEMFELADHPVAVANAIPELKTLAAEVIGPSDQDSVTRWLQAVVNH